jgi:hypothetical protein
MHEDWGHECNECGACPTTHWDEGTWQYYCTEHALDQVLAGNKDIVPYYPDDEEVL